MVERGNIDIIIVFYNPTNRMIARAETLARHYRVFVADNSNTAITSNYHFDYFPMYGNRGIADAQNRTIEQAMSSESKYVLFLDQDSDINTNEIEHLIEIFEELAFNDPYIAALGPCHINDSNLELYKSAVSNAKANTVKVDTLISSGAIIKKDVFRKIGTMDASLFIDYVDFEWCWHARRKGYNLYMTKNVIIRHHLGLGTFRFLGMTFVQSSPFRYYYKSRNLVWLSRRGYVPTNWKTKSWIHTIIELFLVLFHSVYEGNRCQILKQTMNGLWDGFKRQESLRIS